MASYLGSATHMSTCRRSKRRAYGAEEDAGGRRLAAHGTCKGGAQLDDGGRVVIAYLRVFANYDAAVMTSSNRLYLFDTTCETGAQTQGVTSPWPTRSRSRASSIF